MATVTTFAMGTQSPADQTANGVAVDLTIPVVSGSATNGDDITVLTLAPGHTFVVDAFGHDATLGASCTAQLRVDTTAVTGATTAGAADVVPGSDVDLGLSASEQTLNVLIGGADITATANIFIRGRIEQPIAKVLG